MTRVVYVAPDEGRTEVTVLDPYANTAVHALQANGCQVLAVVHEEGK